MCIHVYVQTYVYIYTCTRTHIYNKNNTTMEHKLKTEKFRQEHLELKSGGLKKQRKCQGGTLKQA